MSVLPIHVKESPCIIAAIGFVYILIGIFGFLLIFRYINTIIETSLHPQAQVDQPIKSEVYNRQTCNTLDVRYKSTDLMRTTRLELRCRANTPSMPMVVIIGIV